MAQSHVSENKVSNVALETVSLVALLEEGIRCVREGHQTEGVSCFTVAREQFSYDYMQVTSVIDAFLQSHSSYRQAQEALFVASKRFAETESERQRQLYAIETLLSALRTETDRPTQSTIVGDHPQNGLSHQSAPFLQNSSQDANGQQPLFSGQSGLKESNALPGLYITCFGRFEVGRSGQVIALCRNRGGQAILRYLAAQPGYHASIDTLMEVFWPENPPEVARRKLQIAISALRCSLNTGFLCNPGRGYILCNDEFYLINPAITVQTDVEEFLALWKAGQQANAAQAAELYERACELRTGQFLVEDIYADWSFIQREQLSQVYIAMCHALANYYLEIKRYDDAATCAQAIIKENRCNEEAYRQLMRISAAQGRRDEALRQYQICERVLAEELAVQPMPETVHLLKAIQIGEYLPGVAIKIERK